MDVIALIFLILTDVIAVPLSVLCVIFSNKTKSPFKGICLGLGIFLILLSAGAIVTGGFGLEQSGYYTRTQIIGYYDLDQTRPIKETYSYFYRAPCSWVCLGLCCGVLLFGPAVLFLEFFFRKNNGVTKQECACSNEMMSEKVKINAPRAKNLNYIDELRQLKDLLDEGILTQEEFEQQKKYILSGRR